MNYDEFTDNVFNKIELRKEKQREYKRLKCIEKYNQTVIETQNEYLQLSDEKKILLFDEFIHRYPYLTKELVNHYFKQELTDLLKLG
jgi:hypothetical protein